MTPVQEAAPIREAATAAWEGFQEKYPHVIGALKEAHALETVRVIYMLAFAAGMTHGIDACYRLTEVQVAETREAAAGEL